MAHQNSVENKGNQALFMQIIFSQSSFI